MSRLSAISVDLDSLGHYCHIQGLPESLLDERARALVHRVALPRLLELCAEVGAPVTLFVIGADVADLGLATALRQAAKGGAELASHSYSHAYELSRWAPQAIAADLTRAHTVIAELGGPPRGFRAPGYTLSPPLLETVARLGYAYDSSAYPATPYYAAKAAVMGALALLGRPSKAILDSPRVLRAPRRPYQPSLSAPYERGAAPLWELPIAVTPKARVPFIGTFVTSAPAPLVDSARRALSAEPFVNFELHALDFVDVSDGAPAALARQQRDLLVPFAEKRRRLLPVFRWLAQEYRACTLADVAARLGPPGSAELA